MHGLGRGTRAVMDGVAGIGDFIGSPLYAAARAGGVHPTTFGDLATAAADKMGLGKPENSTQRVLSGVSSAGAGTAATLGMGGLLGPMSKVGQFLTANPA
jgi:hypothetical protein